MATDPPTCPPSFWRKAERESAPEAHPRLRIETHASVGIRRPAEGGTSVAEKDLPTFLPRQGYASVYPMNPISNCQLSADNFQLVNNRPKGLS